MKPGVWIAGIAAVTLAGACLGGENTPPQSDNHHAAGAAEELQTLLTLHGLGTDQLATLADGTPVSADEMPVLLKTLYVLRKLSPAAVEAAAKPATDWTELRSIPAAHRGDAVRVRGTLASLERVEIDEEARDRVELDGLFRCEIEVPEVGRVALYTAEVPKALQADAIGAIVQADGLFLKLSGAGEQAHPVLAARRLGWFPDNLLGRLGMDAGLLERVSQRRALTESDSEAFYMLLGAVNQLSAGEPVELAIQSRNERGVQALFAHPERYVGKLISVRGTARRAVLIKVSDPIARERFGVDQYYELEVFVRFDRLKPELNPLVFVFCVRELPEGIGVGDGLGVPVVAEGVFFKLWTYESRYAREVGSDLRQIAPLAIGRTVSVLRVSRGAESAMPVLLSLAVGTIGIVGALVWWLNYKDRRRRNRRLSSVENIAQEPLGYHNRDTQ